MFSARKAQRGFSKQLVGDLASRRLNKLRAKSKRSTDQSILEFQLKCSPKLYRADHFAIYASELEQGVGGDKRIVFAAPPQHGKTQITLHGLVLLIIRNPNRRFAYVTYSQRRASSVSTAVRRILASAGFVSSGTLERLTFGSGGQCLFTSIDGGITGEPVDGIVVIDDPFKNRKDADSERRREVVEDAYREAIETRVHPGASIFLLATRWHPQDLSGILVKEGWQYINLPAIAEAGDPLGREVGEPLFPRLWPIEALLEKKSKVLDFTWSALYQGRPRPKGGKVFHEPTFYTELPKNFQGAYGIDLASTAKTSADFSVCLELLREDRPNAEPLFYIKQVDRAQVEAPSFALTLKARNARQRQWAMYWRASGMEKGAAQFLQEKGLPIVVQQPPGDKLVSATRAAETWNAGRILVPDPEQFPECEDWLWPFLDIVQNFTGTGKEHDDDVDALGNAHDNLQALGPGQVPSQGSHSGSRWGGSQGRGF